MDDEAAPPPTVWPSSHRSPLLAPDHEHVLSAEEVREIFDAIDTDHSGLLDESEAIRALQRMGAPKPAQVLLLPFSLRRLPVECDELSRGNTIASGCRARPAGPSLSGGGRRRKRRNRGNKRGKRRRRSKITSRVGAHHLAIELIHPLGCLQALLQGRR